MPRKTFFFAWKWTLPVLCSCVLIASGSITYWIIKGNSVDPRATNGGLAPLATLPLTPVATSNNSVSPVATFLPTATPPPGTTVTETTLAPQAETRHSCTLAQHGFETGIVLPSWAADPFGDDATWRAELPQMQAQTAACWVEMPVLFTQIGLHSTQVTHTGGSAAAAALGSGIRLARSLGLRVFVTLLVTVNGAGAEHWVGDVSLANTAQEQQWFTSYWQAIEPYVTAAAQAGADQLSIGTEMQWLEDHAPPTLWNTLIAQIHSVFPGTLTYDVNWTALQEPPPAWMGRSSLDLIGVSAYVPVLNTSTRIDPAQISALWAEKVKGPLDTFASSLGKPIFISEIGYRDSSDALYDPWNTTSSRAADPQEQAAACAAVLSNTLPDQQIFGSFFWAWDGAQELNLKDAQFATSAIKNYYQTLSS